MRGGIRNKFPISANTTNYNDRRKMSLSGPQNNPNNTNATGNSSSNPIVTYYNEWSERTPFVTKFTVIILVITYILSWLFDASDWFADIPAYTLLRFEVYRYVLNPFVGNSLLMLLLTIVMFVIMAGKFESSQGSLRFLFLMGTMSLLTNLAFTVFCFFGLIWDDVALYWACQGFWNVCFALITIDCVLLPDQPRRLLCLPFDIPSLYFPLVLYALFGLLSGYTIDSFFAMCIGYAYGKGFLDVLRPTSYYFENLESSGIWFRLSRNPGWVLAASSLGHDAYVAVNQVDRDPSTERSGGGNTGKKVFGFGDLPSGNASDEASESSAPTSFPGQGHKLAPSGSAGGGVSFGAGLFGGSGNSTAAATATISREELAAKRLAALGKSQKPQGAVTGVPVGDPMNNI